MSALSSVLGEEVFSRECTACALVLRQSKLLVSTFFCFVGLIAIVVRSDSTDRFFGSFLAELFLSLGFAILHENSDVFIATLALKMTNIIAFGGSKPSHSPFPVGP